MSVFRVVSVHDGKEINRYIDLASACVYWAKHPKEVRVEQLAPGSSTAEREVPASECCNLLREWLTTNQHLRDDERKDMAKFIREACEGKSESEDILY